jgi:uncharacterized protein DUF4288
MVMASQFIGLHGFGLSPSRLKRLGTRDVIFSINLKGRPQLPLLRFAPRERQRRLRAALDGQMRRLVRRFPDAALRSRGGLGWTLDGRLPANRLGALAARPEVHFLHVTRIDGLRARREAPRESWFCVRGKVAIQVEGKTRGQLDIEDRFVLVKASGPKDAERRLARDWRSYASPYLNSHGYAVRWKLVAIQDVYDLNQDDIDPRGTEVYSQIKSERMKSEYRWQLNEKRVYQPHEPVGRRRVHSGLASALARRA